MSDAAYKYGDLSGIIIGAAMEVHGKLKSGFIEQVYQRALSVELDLRKVKHEVEYQLPILYKGVRVGARRVDVFAEKIFPVELKAVTELTPENLAQALNYLEAFNLEVGLLINFGAASLQVKRLFNKKFRPQEAPILNPANPENPGSL